MQILKKKTKKTKTTETASTFWSGEFSSGIEYKNDPYSLIKMSSYRRAVANFVKIVTGRNIPVVFNVKDKSFTDGKVVVISARVKNSEIDAAVGLAQHEGIHIVLTDFDLVKRVATGTAIDAEPNNMVNEVMAKLEWNRKKINKVIKNLLNWVEDRRIDHWQYKKAPGYRDYYKAMYRKYFYRPIIDKGLISDAFRIPTWKSYRFRVINLHNKNRDLNALPGLREIWNVVNLGKIDRLKTTRDSFKVAMEMWRIIANHLVKPPVNPFEHMKQELPDEINVAIKDGKFNPNAFITNIGAKVRWTNFDSDNVIIESENGDFKATIKPDESFAYVFEYDGEYNYKSDSGGKGQIVVVENDQLDDSPFENEPDDDENDDGDMVDSGGDDDDDDDENDSDENKSGKGKGKSKKSENNETDGDESENDETDDGDESKNGSKSKNDKNDDNDDGNESENGKSKNDKNDDNENDGYNGKPMDEMNDDETDELEKGSLNDDDKKELDDSVDEQDDYLENGADKEGLEENEEQDLDQMEHSGATLEDTGNGVFTGKVKTLVIKSLSPPMLDKLPIASKNNDHLSEKAVNAGIVFGRKLANHIQVRNETRLQTFTRKRHGKIDRRLVHAVGYGSERISKYTLKHEYGNALIHISIDASGSMGGDPWFRTWACATGLAYVADSIHNLDVIISVRSSIFVDVGDRDTTDSWIHGHATRPLVVIAYDSRVDNFSKVRNIFPKIFPNNYTPEGLAYEAIMKYVLESAAGMEDAYFINFSDGMPYLPNVDGSNKKKLSSYHSSSAFQHTRKQVNKMLAQGIKVLSFFIGDSDSSENRDFRTMYGSNASFIDVTKVFAVARAVNEKLLK